MNKGTKQDLGNIGVQFICLLLSPFIFLIAGCINYIQQKRGEDVVFDDFGDAFEEIAELWFPFLFKQKDDTD